MCDKIISTVDIPTVLLISQVLSRFSPWNFFSRQTAEKDKKTLCSPSKSTILIRQPVYPVFLLDAQSRPGTNVITSPPGLLTTPFPGLKLSVELCSKYACRNTQLSFQFQTRSRYIKVCSQFWFSIKKFKVLFFH